MDINPVTPAPHENIETIIDTEPPADKNSEITIPDPDNNLMPREPPNTQIEPAPEKKFKNDSVSKSWFCVFPNPEENFLDGTPEEIADTMIEMWIKDNPQRSCAVSYCISSDGLRHLHAVLEDTTAMRFSAIKKAFPGMHIEPTKGSKKDAEDYINKRGKFKESGEEIVYTNSHGEIKGASGQRNDLEIIEELINQGLTPNQIFDLSIQFRRHMRIVKDAYYRKRYKETPSLRPLKVYYHTGEAGSGKSYTRVGLVEQHGEENIYTISQFDSGYMDKYSGESLLFIDELRGQIRYSQLLVLLDPQKHDIHARYGNICGLWTEVHITSVFPPERLYRDMITANSDIDTYEQLRRRIHYICYHYIKNDEYCVYEIPMSEYTTLEKLKAFVHMDAEQKTHPLFQGAVSLDSTELTPFDNDDLPIT